MAPLLAARRKHLAATLRLHAHAKAVRLGAAALARLICTLWQSNPPSIPQALLQRFAETFPKLPLALAEPNRFYCSQATSQAAVIACLGTKPSTDRVRSCSGIF
jgi:hypothetical protein